MSLSPLLLFMSPASGPVLSLAMLDPAARGVLLNRTAICYPWPKDHSGAPLKDRVPPSMRWKQAPTLLLLQSPLQDSPPPCSFAL